MPRSSGASRPRRSAGAGSSSSCSSRWPSSPPWCMSSGRLGPFTPGWRSWPSRGPRWSSGTCRICAVTSTRDGVLRVRGRHALRGRHARHRHDRAHAPARPGAVREAGTLARTGPGCWTGCAGTAGPVRPAPVPARPARGEGAARAPARRAVPARALPPARGGDGAIRSAGHCVPPCSPLRAPDAPREDVPRAGPPERQAAAADADADAATGLALAVVAREALVLPAARAAPRAGAGAGICSAVPPRSSGPAVHRADPLRREDSSRASRGVSAGSSGAGALPRRADPRCSAASGAGASRASRASGVPSGSCAWPAGSGGASARRCAVSAGRRVPRSASPGHPARAGVLGR